MSNRLPELFTGQKFNRLTVIESAGRNDSGSIVYKCSCDCGNIKKITGSDLISNYIKSCGCLRREHTLQMAASNIGTVRLDLRKEPYRWLYTDLCNAAKYRRISVDISYEEFVRYTEITECFYCGVDINWPKPHSDDGGYNLDRKDCKQGYHKDNIVVCCKRCNNGKGDRFSFEEWSKMAAALK
jgi:hypothetical protein